MALRGTYKKKTGLIIESAYANIASIVLNKITALGTSGYMALIIMDIYANEESYRSGLPIEDKHTEEFSLDESATISWAYELIKSRNVLHNAEDC